MRTLSRNTERARAPEPISASAKLLSWPSALEVIVKYFTYSTQRKYTA